MSFVDGTYVAQFAGAAGGDNAGWSVSGAGDVNGDGYDDVIIGAYGASPASRNAAGSSYVVFGKATGLSNVDLATFSSASDSVGFRIDGAAAGDVSGVSVSGAGDVNGDGYDDIVVGAYYAAPSSRAGAGSSYVVLGKASGFSNIDLATFDSVTGAGFRIDGAASSDKSGFSVSSAGDMNGDGYDDVIIGAYGASPASRNAAGSSYVVFGKATGLSNVDLATFSSASDSVGFRIDGGAASDNAGVSVSGAGDVNGDGYDDVIIGAYTASPSAGTYAGSSYVVFGMASGFSNVDLATFSSASDSVGYRIDGAAAGDFSGVSVSGAGDVNGDSYADVVVGAHLSDPSSRPSAGSSYVLFGKASGFSNVALSTLVTASDSVGFRIDGAAAGDYAGYSVSGAGDVNGDGYGDVIVGAYAADPSSRSQAGSSYVVFGKASDFSNVDLASFGLAADNMGYRIDGAVADDQAGYSVSYAGDLNADGFADVIVGAFNAAPKSRPSAGSSYALQGKTSGFSNVDLSGVPSPSDTSSPSDSFWSSTGTGLVGGLGALFIAVTAAVMIKAYVYPTTGNAEGSGKTAVELKTAVAPQSEEL